MKQTVWLSCLLSIMIFSSCQKEVAGEIVPATGGNTSSSTANDYQPVTAGSEWNYASPTFGNYTIKAIGTDTLINGVKYYRFSRIDAQGTTNLFWSKENGVYSSFGYFAPTGTVVNFIELKDAPIGTTWTNTISASGYNNYHKLIVVGKGLQHTVLSKSFSNVIALDYEFSGDDPSTGGVTKMGDGKRYFAKGVGAIENIYNVSMYGLTVIDTTRLLSYTIK